MSRPEASPLMRNLSLRNWHAWTAFRTLILLAGASLALYIPYKYVTQLHATQGIYAFLFPLSSILAVGGIVLGLKPSLMFRIPLPARAALVLLAAGWIATGVLCIPSLTRMTLETPLAGVFATFHMLVQHLVLSISVGTLALAPGATYAQFGLPVPVSGRRAAEKWAPGNA